MSSVVRTGRWRLHACALTLCTVLASCGARENDCGIADGIRRLDSLARDGAAYFLILRSSGFQDKVLYFELYDAEPQFDPCGRSRRAPLWSEPIENHDTGRFVRKVLFRESGQEKKLEVIYTRNKSEAVDVYQARLSRD